MLFEDRIIMAPQKEKQFTVRLDEATYNYLVKKAGALDVSRSDVVRAAVLLSLPQIEKIPSLLKVELQDIIGDE